MYKCPYCRHDSKTQQCEHCHAMIPAETKAEKPNEEPVTTRKRHKEMKKDGT